MRPPSIVVSGFEAFGGFHENPTIEVTERLARWSACPGTLSTVRLPVDTARITDLVGESLDVLRPDVWIGLGLATGSCVVAVERIGINVLDFAIADNAGRRFQGAPIDARGPAAHLATLPVATIVEDLRAAGIPATVSNSASTYLCNQLLYTVLHLVRSRSLGTRTGFLHVPAHPALAARQPNREVPSMAVDLMVEAVKVAIVTTLRDAGGS